MSLKRAALNAMSAALVSALRLFGERNGAIVAAHLAERLAPLIWLDTPHGPLRFHCPGSMPRWRAETLLSKEPETIEWMDGFADDVVFWDVGANVGVYSLYAALRPGIRVVAFEPSAFNYHVLMRNIEWNGFGERISAYCLALSNVTKCEDFYMTNTEVGGALSSFGRPTNSQNDSGAIKFRHAALGYSIDDFIARFAPAFPNHLKIDVDGNEDKIIQGAGRTLADRRLGSVLIEMDDDKPEYSQEVVDHLEAAGLRLVAKRHAPMFEHGPYASMFNCIFERKG